jgi:hypothetical protein
LAQRQAYDPLINSARAGGLTPIGSESNERRRLQYEPAQVPQKVGVTSQREIEKAVRGALDAGRLKGTETLAVNRCRA